MFAQRLARLIDRDLNYIGRGKVACAGSVKMGLIPTLPEHSDNIHNIGLSSVIKPREARGALALLLASDQWWSRSASSPSTSLVLLYFRLGEKAVSA